MYAVQNVITSINAVLLRYYKKKIHKLIYPLVCIVSITTRPLSILKFQLFVFGSLNEQRNFHTRKSNYKIVESKYSYTVPIINLTD
jgi:hypothetical protein